MSPEDPQGTPGLRRRLVLILIVVLVIGAITAGIVFYTRHNSGQRMLQKAYVSLRAKEYEQARKSAENYVREHPRDWRGYDVLAQALSRLGRYQEAREVLQTPLEMGEQGQLDKADVSELIRALADTYALPARQTVVDEQASLDAAREARGNLDKALEILLEGQQAAPEDLNLLADRGFTRMLRTLSDRKLTALTLAGRADALADSARSVLELAATLNRVPNQIVEVAILESALDRLTNTARDLARNPSWPKSLELIDEVDRFSPAVERLAAQSPQTAEPTEPQTGPSANEPVERGIPRLVAESRQVAVLAGEILSEARPFLQAARTDRRLALELSVETLEKNAARPAEEQINVSGPARRIVDLAERREDLPVVTAGRQALSSMDDPPAAVLAELIVRQLTLFDRLEDPAGWQELLRSSMREGRALLEKHPRENEVVFAVAQMARAVGESDLAEQLCRRIVQAGESRRHEARLLLSQILLEQGQMEEAEDHLATLKPLNSPQVLYLYARSIENSNPQLAKQDLSQALQLDPTHAAAAKMLIRLQMEDGFYKPALDLAERYLAEHPEDPDAVDLYVRSARRSGQPGQATRQLDRKLAEVRSQDRPDPVMLASLARGYEVAGERRTSRELARRIVEITPRGPAEVIAVADASIALGETARARGLLSEELRRTNDDPRLHAKLGEVLIDQRQLLQGVEHLERALELNPANQAYRLQLAEARLELGDFERALELIDPLGSDPRARLLHLRIARRRGEPVEIDPALESYARQRQGGLAPAILAYENGQYERCIEVCDELLAVVPDDTRAIRLKAMACMQLERFEQAAETFARVLAVGPGRLESYRDLAAALQQAYGLDEALQRLEKTPQAREELVRLVSASMLASADRFPRARELYGGLIDKEDLPEGVRALALVGRAQLNVREGRVEPALADLDRLAAYENWQAEALLIRAELLGRADRKSDAAATLEEVQRLAARHARQDRAREAAEMLRRAAVLFAAMDFRDRALEAADRYRDLRAGQPAPLLFKARLLRRFRRPLDAAELIREAIALQQERAELRFELARALDEAGRYPQALEALSAAEELGWASEVRARLLRGELLARWGLYAPAVEVLDSLAERQRVGPRMDLLLARALARLGERARAVELLEKIPEISSVYLPSRQLLLDLAETPGQKLKYLRQLQQRSPQDPLLLMRRMQILREAGRSGEAADAYQAYRLDAFAEAVPRPLTALALACLCDEGNSAEAVDLAVQTGTGAGARSPWLAVAASLAAEDDPDRALEVLPEIEKANLYEAGAGVAAARSAGNAAALAAWSKRFEEIVHELIQPAAGEVERPLGPARLDVELPAALLAGDEDRAGRILRNLSGLGEVDSHAAAQLVDRMQDRPEETAPELARLLRAAILGQLGLPDLAREWAMAVLREDPSLQWAARIFVRFDPETGEVREVASLVQPQDGRLALMLRARLAREQGDYGRAVELYRRFAADSQDPAMLFDFAYTLELAGEVSEAVSLYRKIHEMTGSASAANNAAYLLSRDSDSPEALAEALKLSETALKSNPAQPHLLETRAWILHRQGRSQEALLPMRRALRGLEDSIEGHYHAGMVELAAGDEALGRWHLQAAVRQAERMSEQDRPLGVADRQALQKAREALAEQPATQEAS